MLPSEIPKLPTDPPVRGFPGVWKLPFLHGSLLDGSPSLTLLSLFLSFIFCSVSFQREWAVFLGAWCPLPVFRSCFEEFVQHSNDLSMNLWGRNWSPCPIPSPSYNCPLCCLVDNGHSGMRWYHIVFWFSFPWWLVMLSIFHVPVGHLYIFFGKVSI